MSTNPSREEVENRTKKFTIRPQTKITLQETKNHFDKLALEAEIATLRYENGLLKEQLRVIKQFVLTHKVEPK